MARTWRRPTIWAVAGPSALALPLASQAAAAVRPRPAHQGAASTVKHWGKVASGATGISATADDVVIK